MAETRWYIALQRGLEHAHDGDLFKSRKIADELCGNLVGNTGKPWKVRVCTVIDGEPIPLAWTTETPKEAGWYWCLTAQGERFVEPWEECDLANVVTPGLQWAGPVPEPHGLEPSAATGEREI